MLIEFKLRGDETESCRDENKKLTLLEYIYGVMLREIHTELLKEKNGKDKKEAIEKFGFFEFDYEVPEMK